MKDVVVVGAGGFAREVQDIIRDCNIERPTYNFLGFIDDFVAQDIILNDSSVIGTFDWFKTKDARKVNAIVAVGAPELRYRLVKRLEKLDVEFFSVVHPSVVFSPFVKFGIGTVITAGCILTNNITIRNHVHLNLDSTVGHDAIMEDFSTTAPGVHINGHNVIEEGAYLGTGVNIIEGITVGKWSIVGTGAAIVRDIPPNTTAVGCPAKVIKTRDEGWYKS